MSWCLQEFRYKAVVHPFIDIMALEWDDPLDFELSEIEKTEHLLRHQLSLKSMKLF